VYVYREEINPYRITVIFTDHFGMHFTLTISSQQLYLLKCSKGQEKREIGLSYAKEIVSISSAVWAQCTNLTDKQTTVTSIASIAYQRCRLKRF